MKVLHALLLEILLMALVAACAGGRASGATPPPGAGVTVTASQGRFEPSRIEVPAGRPVNVFFRNLDPVPHNISVSADGWASPRLFAGEAITDSAMRYVVPALEPGEYAFRCDVHPEMRGTLMAGE